MRRSTTPGRLVSVLLRKDSELRLPATIAAEKSRGGFGVGDVHAPLAGHEEFAAHRRHGIEKIDRRAARGQHLVAEPPDLRAFYGTTTAQRLAEYNIFETVVLTDILDGKGPEQFEAVRQYLRTLDGK